MEMSPFLRSKQWKGGKRNVYSINKKMHSCDPADPYTTRVGTRVGILVELVVKQLTASTTAVKNSRHHHLSISIIAVNESDRDPAPLAPSAPSKRVLRRSEGVVQLIRLRMCVLLHARHSAGILLAPRAEKAS